MEITKIICNKNFQIDKVDSRLFGSFLEHMGRVIYSGIYEPDNINSDEDGFRKDVLEQVKQNECNYNSLSRRKFCFCLSLGGWSWT
mgnify:CR=1 FL=1